MKHLKTVPAMWEIVSPNSAICRANAWAISPDGKYLATSHPYPTPGRIRITELATDVLVQSLDGGPPEDGLSFLGNGRILATVIGKDINLHVVSTGELIARVQNVGSPAAISPDGRTLATASGRGAVLWDVRPGQVPTRLTTLGEDCPYGVRAIRFFPDGRHLFTKELSSAHIWDLQTHRCVWSGEHDTFDLQVLSPDGRLGAMEIGNYVKVWDFRRNRVILIHVLNGKNYLLTPHSGPCGRSISRLVFSRDAKMLAIEIENQFAGTILWHLKWNRPMAFLDGYSPIGFFPDGNLIVTAKNTITLCDLRGFFSSPFLVLRDLLRTAFLRRKVVFPYGCPDVTSGYAMATGSGWKSKDTRCRGSGSVTLYGDPPFTFDCERCQQKYEITEGGPGWYYWVVRHADGSKSTYTIGECPTCQTALSYYGHSTYGEEGEHFEECMNCGIGKPVREHC